MATGLKYYFGIDFGTTNSATVGYVVMDQKPEAVKYGDEEGRPIPSVVAIDKTTGAVFTGRDAWDKKMELSESCEYISSVKTILDSEQIKTIAGCEWTAVDVASEVFKYLKANVHNRQLLRFPLASAHQSVPNCVKQQRKPVFILVLLLVNPLRPFLQTIMN